MNEMGPMLPRVPVAVVLPAEVDTMPSVLAFAPKSGSDDILSGASVAPPVAGAADFENPVMALEEPIAAGADADIAGAGVAVVAAPVAPAAGTARDLASAGNCWLRLEESPESPDCKDPNIAPAGIPGRRLLKRLDAADRASFPRMPEAGDPPAAAAI